jgi:hypothetical protein
MRMILRAASVATLFGTSAALAADIGVAPDYYAPPPQPLAQAASPGIFGDATLSATFLANDLSDDDWAASLGGVFVFPLGNGWSASIQGNTSYLFDSEEWASLLEADVFYVAPGWAAGAFVSAGDEEVYTLGGEAAVFTERFDFLGEVGYVFADTDAVEAAAAAYYYITPDTYVGATVGSTWFDGGGDFQTASVGAEHRFADTPVTGFIDAGWDNAAGDNFQVTAGSRILFGTYGTLKDYFRANPF